MSRAILITGSREWKDRAAIRRVLAAAADAETGVARQLGEDDAPMLLIHGDAQGADHIAADIAREMGWDVLPLTAQWAKYGKKAAGPERNSCMVIVATQLKLCGWRVEVHAFPLPQSRGTWDCVQRAKRAALDVIVHGAAGGGHATAAAAAKES